MRKKLITLLLTLAAVFALLTISASAADILDSGTCGEDLTWTLDSDGLLVISGTGDMENFSSSRDVPWYDNKSNVQTVVIQPGVTSIGDMAFFFYSNLTSVTIPDSVTSIGRNTFRNCSGLTSIAIPDSVNSIGKYAFSYCAGLTEIVIPDFLTKIANHTFAGCENLKCATISSSVTSIDNGAFEDCANLTEVYYTGTEEQWENIGINDDNSCLTDAPIFHFSPYPTGICGKYAKWTLTNDGVMTISGKGEMNDYYPDVGSYKCPWSEYVDSIKAVVMESGVTTVGYNAFKNCSNLSSISLPASVTSIESYAFLSCDSLTSVTIPKNASAFGTGVFGDCDSLTRIDVDANNPNYRSVDGILMSKDKTVLVQYPAGKPGEEYQIPENITSIHDGAFYGCDSLTSVTAILAGITEIGNEAFRDCKNLTYVDIPDSVVSIGRYAFRGSGLPRVTLGTSLNYIGPGGFPEDTLTDVYYCGTEEEWSNVTVWSGNNWYHIGNYLPGTATIHYNFHRAEITEQPTDVTVIAGNTARITVHAVGDGLTYKWQYSDDNGATWLPSSLKTATYSAKLTAEKDGRQVRCIVTDEAGNYVTSAPAVMRVSNLKITTQPKDYVGAVNSTAKFTVAASGDGLKYQWQYSDDNGKTWLASSIKSATYSAKFTAEKNGRMVRCIVSDQYGSSVTSNTAQMALNGPIITTQPKDYIGAVNSTAKFTVAASGTGLKYQWQYSDDNGATWLASSLKSATYSAKFTAEKNNRMVRCIVTDASGSSVTSNAAKMTLSGPVITAQPQNYVGAVNSTAKFTVAASGSGLTYKWQYSDDNGATWLASSLKSATYSAKFTAEKNNRMVRCIVTDASGNTVTSNAVSMRIG